MLSKNHHHHLTSARLLDRTVISRTGRMDPLCVHRPFRRIYHSSVQNLGPAYLGSREQRLHW